MRVLTEAMPSVRGSDRAAVTEEQPLSAALDGRTDLSLRSLLVVVEVVCPRTRRGDRAAEVAARHEVADEGVAIVEEKHQGAGGVTRRWRYIPCYAVRA